MKEHRSEELAQVKGVRLTQNQIEVTLGFSIIDTAEIVEIDKDRDAHISKEELADAVIELQKLGTNALDVKLDQHPHELALALAPMASQRQSQSPVQIIAQRLLVFIVFGTGHSQNRVASS